jgi:transglutaminase/protease-like cytokinesis protein 3
MARIYKKLLLVFLLLTLSGHAQMSGEVDRKVLLYPEFSSLNDLGIRIQNDFGTDSLRVRAAFIWVAHNIGYDYKGELRNPNREKIAYSNEEEKHDAVNQLVWRKINRAFQFKRGVCIDYSLILNALFEQFRIPSKIIAGVAKTEIKQLDGAPAFRNHSWNAVQVGGFWRLMDPTWASGSIDVTRDAFVRNYNDHYFYTEPSDFIRHHLPANEEWQLLETPVDPVTFFNSPIFLPEYCEKGIELSTRTSGILTLAEEQVNYIYFDQLPREHLMYYTIDDSDEKRRMGLRKEGNKTYSTKIRLRKRFNRSYETLTVYMNHMPILSFKIQEELP